MIKKTRLCDNCGVKDSKKNNVSPYRWMRVMDKYNYKHRILVKVDLCDDCASKIILTLKKQHDV